MNQYTNFGIFQAHRSFLEVDDRRIRGNDKRIDSYTAPSWKIVISRKAQEPRIMNAIHPMCVSQYQQC